MTMHRVHGDVISWPFSTAQSSPQPQRHLSSSSLCPDLHSPGGLVPWLAVFRLFRVKCSSPQGARSQRASCSKASFQIIGPRQTKSQKSANDPGADGDKYPTSRLVGYSSNRLRKTDSMRVNTRPSILGLGGFPLSLAFSHSSSGESNRRSSEISDSGSSRLVSNTNTLRTPQFSDSRRKTIHELTRRHLPLTTNLSFLWSTQTRHHNSAG
jgi:hypothetical protein